MIIRKIWKRPVRSTFGVHVEDDLYTGWFLLGIIPLYVKSVRVRH